MHKAWRGAAAGDAVLAEEWRRARQVEVQPAEARTAACGGRGGPRAASESAFEQAAAPAQAMADDAVLARQWRRARPAVAQPARERSGACGPGVASETGGEAAPAQLARASLAAATLAAAAGAATAALAQERRHCPRRRRARRRTPRRPRPAEGLAAGPRRRRTAASGRRTAHSTRSARCRGPSPGAR